MTDAPYDGFRFEHSRPDINSPGGKLTCFIVAIARTMEEAKKLAGELLPERGLHLIARGADVLKEAKARGLDEGQAKVI